MALLPPSQFHLELYCEIRVLFAMLFDFDLPEAYPALLRG